MSKKSRPWNRRQRRAIRKRTRRAQLIAMLASAEARAFERFYAPIPFSAVAALLGNPPIERDVLIAEMSAALQVPARFLFPLDVSATTAAREHEAMHRTTFPRAFPPRDDD